MDKVRIIETHWTTSHVPSAGEYESRWWVKRSLYKRWCFIWLFRDSQTILKDPNQAITNATLGTTWSWDLIWRRKFLGKPYKIIYR